MPTASGDSNANLKAGAPDLRSGPPLDLPDGPGRLAASGPSVFLTAEDGPLAIRVLVYVAFAVAGLFALLLAFGMLWAFWVYYGAMLKALFGGA